MTAWSLVVFIYKVIESARVRAWSAILAIGAIVLLIVGPDHSSKIVSGVVLALVVLKLLRMQSRRAALQLAVCPRDGGKLNLSLKQWGPRGTPLLQCPIDRSSYYVSSWRPLELTEVDPGME